jgi:hypothetical protein
VLYSATARSNVAFRVLGYVEITTDAGTPGNWSASPSVVQPLLPGMPLPGDVVQSVRVTDGAVATGTTQVPLDDTIPQITEGDQYLSLAITPRSELNLLDVRTVAFFSMSAAESFISALFRDGGADALAAMTSRSQAATSSVFAPANIAHVVAAGSVSATTFKLRAGPIPAATLTFNGYGGARKLGGVYNSYMQISEVMA